MGASTATVSLTYPFVLQPLPYAYNALVPHIDAATMRLHHSKHHQAYVDKLNDTLKNYPAWQTLTIEDLMRRLEELPVVLRLAVRDQGGGHANHQLFWEMMAPGQVGTRPAGPLAAGLIDAFGSFGAFQKAFNDAATKIFGSGWVFLVCGPGCERFEILSLPNQDSPLSQGKLVLLGNDMWEHAYYLQYQNRGPDYLAAWWNVVNWEGVSRRLFGYRANQAGKQASRDVVMSRL